MRQPDPTPETAFFWEIAEPFLADPATGIGTLMQFPACASTGTSSPRATTEPATSSSSSPADGSHS